VGHAIDGNLKLGLGPSWHDEYHIGGDDLVIRKGRRLPNISLNNAFHQFQTDIRNGVGFDVTCLKGG
jgi:hypothetical protein